MADQKTTTTERQSVAERPVQVASVAALGRGGRMSRKRKMDAVLRLLRGKDLETVSRNLSATEATPSQWRDAFLSAGEAALTSKPQSGEALQAETLRTRLGEALTERELLEEKSAILEAKRPLARGRRKP